MDTLIRRLILICKNYPSESESDSYKEINKFLLISIGLFRSSLRYSETRRVEIRVCRNFCLRRKTTAQI